MKFASSFLPSKACAWVLWACAWATAFGLSAPCAFADNGVNHYGEVMQAMNSGKLSQAQALADAYISSNPRDPQMRVLKAEVLSLQGQTVEAISLLETLRAEYPELPEPYNNLAALYAKQGAYDKARAALEMAIKANPRYLTAIENLGDVYAKLASEQYAQALALNPASLSLPIKMDRLSQVFENASNAAVFIDGTNPPDLANEPVVKALQAWAKAWSLRDMPAYLASYAPDFQPAKQQAFDQWRTERYQRITSRKRIQVGLKDLRIQYPTDHTAVATFLETYQADGLSLTHQKVMELKRIDNRWLIVRESADE